MKKKKMACTNELPFAEISAFWQQCIEDGTIEALCRYIPEENLFGDCIVGASFGNDAADADFPYAIGAIYNGAPVTEKAWWSRRFRPIPMWCSHAEGKCRKRLKRCISG